MNLNLTLLVQAFNFFIAYMLIDRLFFDPVLKNIQEDTDRVMGLQAALESEKVSLQQSKSTMEIRWQECRSYFFKHRPLKEFTDSFITEAAMPLHLKKLNYRALETAKDKIVSSLVTKLREF